VKERFENKGESGWGGHRTPRKVRKDRIFVMYPNLTIKGRKRGRRGARGHGETNTGQRAQQRRRPREHERNSEEKDMMQNNINVMKK
jgi:hypothetical protein